MSLLEFLYCLPSLYATDGSTSKYFSLIKNLIEYSQKIIGICDAILAMCGSYDLQRFCVSFEMFRTGVTV